MAVLGAGAVGALAYTFTDTFWFSAVEGEVYALSSMFTALVVWLMLKWEEQADEPHSSRWIVLIAYLMGLSIGVHILNLLCIPALVFIYYFRKTATVTWRGIALSTLVSGAMIVFVNNIIIPYTVWIGAQIDTLFVNTFGLPVNSGITLFALALIIGLGWAAWAAHRRGRVLLNIILLSTTMILVGYSSYASVTIRAAANPPMNSNNPNNPHALLSLLNRDQYGDRPLLYGAQYSAPPEGVKEKKVWYLDEDGKYKTATVLTGYTHAPEFMQLFPRMWNYSKGEKAYKEWAAYRTKTETLRDDKGEVLRDAQGRPMRGETLDFGRKRAYTDSYGETRTVTEPTFWRKPQLLLQLPAFVHVLALFPVELRGTPERHTAFAHDDHRRQLALGHPLDRREIPRPAGQPAARNRRKQGPQHLLFPPLPAGTHRTRSTS